MGLSTLLVIIALFLAGAFFMGRKRSIALSSRSGGIAFLDSLPVYYGVLTAFWAALPALCLVLIWIIFDAQIIEALVLQGIPAEQLGGSEVDKGLLLNTIYNVAAGDAGGETRVYVLEAAAAVNSFNRCSASLLFVFTIAVMLIGAGWVWLRIRPEMRARVGVEQVFRLSLLACSCLAVLTTAGIVFSVLFESLRFFSAVPPSDFLFGLQWSPQTAIRAGQVAGESSFGAVPLFAGTLLIAFIAMVVAVPTGLMSAIYLSEYADKRVRSVVKPLLEVLAGIPTVVYGFFAAITVAPFIRDLATGMGLDQWMNVTSESALAAGLVMGIMIIPFVSSLSDDVINAVPQSLRDGAFGLGATKSEMVTQVVIPAALPGIVGGVLLAISRAIGETMIVVMAAGLAAKLTANPLDSVTTVTVQIVTLLVGDQEFDSPKTLAAFALGLMLFVVTLALNYIALHVVRKYREQYD